MANSEDTPQSLKLLTNALHNIIISHRLMIPEDMHPENSPNDHLYVWDAEPCAVSNGQGVEAMVQAVFLADGTFFIALRDPKTRAWAFKNRFPSFSKALGVILQCSEVDAEDRLGTLIAVMNLAKPA